MILRSRYIYADPQGVVENGALHIDDDGMITHVDTSPREAGSAHAVDLGDAILLPAFVNAHTHLELTHLAGRVPPSHDFVDWLERVVALMRADKDPQATAARSAAEGCKLSRQAGVTAVGDITRWPGATRPELEASLLRSCSYGEVIAVGKLRDQLDRLLNQAAERNSEWLFLRSGLSPHAPYTVEPPAMQACAARSNRDDTPTSIHLAESADEASFTLHLRGPLRAFLERLGIWDDGVSCPGMSPVMLAEHCGLLHDRCVLAHVNYVNDDEIDRIAISGASVAYCPRTHAAFGHPPHRYLDMLDRGVNVCLATDSLASSPTLSPLDDARFLWRNGHRRSASLLIDMITSRGAAALDMSVEVGSIKPERWANLVAFPLPAAATLNPLEYVLEEDIEPIAIWSGGEDISLDDDNA